MFSFFISMVLFGQANSNPFAGENTDNNAGNVYSSPQNLNKSAGQPENGVLAKGNGKGNNGNGWGNGGNPGDPVPVDDYIPVLLVVALGFIVYQKRLVKSTKA